MEVCEWKCWPCYLTQFSKNSQRHKSPHTKNKGVLSFNSNDSKCFKENWNSIHPHKIFSVNLFFSLVRTHFFNVALYEKCYPFRQRLYPQHMQSNLCQSAVFILYYFTCVSVLPWCLCWEWTVGGFLVK